VCLAARIGVVQRSGQIDATKPFARTQRLRLVMRLLLELKNRSLVGPEWQLYILSWTAETVAEDLQGSRQTIESLLNRRLSRCKVSVYCP
jgi:hypothetical protein